MSVRRISLKMLQTGNAVVVHLRGMLESWLATEIENTLSTSILLS